jgi:RecG-like helicase
MTNEKPKKSTQKNDIMRKEVAKRLIDQIKNKKQLSVKKAMEESGYSPSYANTKGIKAVRNSKEVQAGIKSFSDQLEEMIQANLEHMRKKQKKATFRDAVEVVNSFKKLNQLIEGKPTDAHIVVNWSNSNDKEAK